MKKSLFILIMLVILLSGCLNQATEKKTENQTSGSDVVTTGETITTKSAVVGERVKKLLREENIISEEVLGTTTETTTESVLSIEHGLANVNLIYESGIGYYNQVFTDSIRNSPFNSEQTIERTKVKKLKIEYLVIDSEESYREYLKSSTIEEENLKKINDLWEHNYFTTNEAIILYQIRYITEEVSLKKADYKDSAIEELKSEQNVFRRNYGDMCEIKDERGAYFRLGESINISMLKEYNLEDIRKFLLKKIKNRYRFDAKEELTTTEKEMDRKLLTGSWFGFGSNVFFVNNLEPIMTGKIEDRKALVIAEFEKNRDEVRKIMPLNSTFEKYKLPEGMADKNYYDVFYDAREKEEKLKILIEKLHKTTNTEEYKLILKEIELVGGV